MALSKITNAGVATSGLPTGSVLQVIQGSTTTPSDTTSTSFQDSNITASITPTSASSKILVIADFGSGATNSQGGCIVNLVRGSTQLFYRGVAYSDGGSSTGSSTLCHLDSPATTSSVTYKVQFLTQNTNSTVAVNSGFGGYMNPTAHMTLMEIAG